MEIILKRIAKRSGYTIGRLYIAPSNLIPEQGSPIPDVPSPTRSLSRSLSPEGRGEKEASPTGKATGRRDSGNGGLEEAGSSPLLGGQRGAFCDTLEPPCLEWKTPMPMEAIMRIPQMSECLKPFAIPPGR